MTYSSIFFVFLKNTHQIPFSLRLPFLLFVQHILTTAQTPLPTFSFSCTARSAPCMRGCMSARSDRFYTCPHSGGASRHRGRSSPARPIEGCHSSCNTVRRRTKIPVALLVFVRETILPDLYHEELIQKNPMANVEMIKKSNFLSAQDKEELPECETVTVFTPDEIEKFKAEAFRCWSNGKRIYQQPAAYILMLNTGLRTGELLGLLNSDIDLDKKVLYVQRGVKEVSRKNGTEFTSGRDRAERSAQSQAHICDEFGERGQTGGWNDPLTHAEASR